MTVPSEEYSKTEIVICPNCGSHNMDEKWINKSHKQQRKEMTMQEKAKSIEAKDAPQSYSGINFIGCVADFIGIPIQYILKCEECGYTITKDIIDAEQRA